MIPKHSTLELALMYSDAAQFVSLGTSSNSIVAMTFYAPLAMFAVESLSRLTLSGLGKGSLGAYAPAIQKARHSVKFLDDSGRSAKAIIDGYGKILEAHRQRFIGMHRGLLGPLKRLLSTDLGLHYYRGVLVATTHGLSAHLGVDDEALTATSTSNVAPGQLLHDRAKALGQYTATFLRALGVEPTEIPPCPPVANEYQDIRAQRYYSNVCNTREPHALSVGMALGALLAHGNAMLYLLPQVAQGEAKFTRLFTLKWRLIALVHTLSSINQLLKLEGRARLLSERAKGALVALKRKEKISSQMRDIRNGLVHYDATKLYDGWANGLSTLVDEKLGIVCSALTELFPRPSPDGVVG